MNNICGQKGQLIEIDSFSRLEPLWQLLASGHRRAVGKLVKTPTSVTILSLKRVTNNMLSHHRNFVHLAPDDADPPLLSSSSAPALLLLPGLLSANLF